jgi:hypothetical protein
VNEGSTAYLTVTFLDKDGNAEAPTSVTWEVHDVPGGEELQGATAIAAASEIEITLPPAVNAILDDDKEWEQRRVTVKASYGASDAVNSTFDYRVLNLSAV